jgi:hypothetical protein
MKSDLVQDHLDHNGVTMTKDELLAIPELRQAWDSLQAAHKLAASALEMEYVAQEYWMNACIVYLNR